MRFTVALLAASLALTIVPAVSFAEPVPVKFAEGVTRGFPVLRSVSGEKLAQGDLVQVAHGDRVESRLVFRFLDGSRYEEQLAFSQRGVFRLLHYHICQRGPSFPETIDAELDRETGRYAVRYRADEDSPEETFNGTFTMPEDVYNGMLTTLLKNVPASEPRMVEIVAFTPKPRSFKMLLQPVGEDPVQIGDLSLHATRFRLKPQLGLFASLLVTDIPDVNVWVVAGDAPGFLRFEGPLYFMGPIWRVEPN